MAKSNRREKVKLVSTAGTGYYYTLNKLKGQDKLTLKKYDPKVRKHVDFKGQSFRSNHIEVKC